MNYPVAYAVIPEEEKTYIVGSGDVQYEKLFNYFIGDFLRDTVKSDVRNAIWNSAKQSSFTPIANWFKNVDDMGVIAHLGYFYGFWHIWRDVKSYLGSLKSNVYAKKINFSARASGCGRGPGCRDRLLARAGEQLRQGPHGSAG